VSISNTITPSGLETLKATVAGDVFVPGDGGHDEVRRGWDLVVDQRPAVVVDAESAVDVVRAVRFARSQGMRIAPQSTGHGLGPAADSVTALAQPNMDPEQPPVRPIGA
jgi:FAD/FMN-containing dehydrogenase